MSWIAPPIRSPLHGSQSKPRHFLRWRQENLRTKTTSLSAKPNQKRPLLRERQQLSRNCDFQTCPDSALHEISLRQSKPARSKLLLRSPSVIVNLNEQCRPIQIIKTENSKIRQTTRTSAAISIQRKQPASFSRKKSVPSVSICGTEKSITICESVPIPKH